MKTVAKRGGFATAAVSTLSAVLVRNSRLSTEYIRENLDTINTPVQIELDLSFKRMASNWSEEELSNERRLVHVIVERVGCSVFRIWCEAVSPQFGAERKDEFIISCIRWNEKNTHVLTSVDLIHLLENLVGESFSTQEKSRIRRNLQFLKPFTVNRISSARLFNALMAMDNPRPRNIEKDLKVFQWLTLYVALTMVLNKYSVNPAAVGNKPVPQGALRAVRDVTTAFTGASVTPNGNNGSKCLTPSMFKGVRVIPTASAPLPVNSFTALPRSFATKSSQQENRPRPRPGCLISASFQAAASYIRARFAVERRAVAVF